MKPPNLNRYYIIDLKDMANPVYLNEPFRDREVAQLAIEYYLPKGYYLIYRGSKVRVMGLSPSPYKYPKYSQKAMRSFKLVNHRYKKHLLKGSGINVGSFKRVWEPIPPDRASRNKFHKTGQSVLRTTLLK